MLKVINHCLVRFSYDVAEQHLSAGALWQVSEWSTPFIKQGMPVYKPNRKQLSLLLAKPQYLLALTSTDFAKARLGVLQLTIAVREVITLAAQYLNELRGGLALLDFWKLVQQRDSVLEFSAGILVLLKTSVSPEDILHSGLLSYFWFMNLNDIQAVETVYQLLSIIAKMPEQASLSSSLKDLLELAHSYGVLQENYTAIRGFERYVLDGSINRSCDVMQSIAVNKQPILKLRLTADNLKSLYDVFGQSILVCALTTLESTWEKIKTAFGNLIQQFSDEKYFALYECLAALEGVLPVQRFTQFLPVNDLSKLKDFLFRMTLICEIPSLLSKLTAALLKQAMLAADINEIIKIKVGSVRTPLLHYIAEQGPALLPGLLLDLLAHGVSATDIRAMLKIKNCFGDTILHHLAEKEPKLLPGLLLALLAHGVSATDISEILKIKNHFDKTFLYYFSEKTEEEPELLPKLLLELLTKGISAVDIGEILHYLSQKKSKWLPGFLLNLLAQGESTTNISISEILKIKDMSGSILLHYLVQKNPEVLPGLLLIWLAQGVAAVDISEILKIKDPFNKILFHYLAQKNSEELPSLLLNLLAQGVSVTDISVILKMRDSEGKTPVHYLADNNIVLLPGLLADLLERDFLREDMRIILNTKRLLAYLPKKVSEKRPAQFFWNASVAADKKLSSNENCKNADLLTEKIVRPNEEKSVITQTRRKRSYR